MNVVIVIYLILLSRGFCNVRVYMTWFATKDAYFQLIPYKPYISSKLNVDLMKSMKDALNTVIMIVTLTAVSHL